MKAARCVGCDELLGTGAVRVPVLGRVCAFCYEVVDIVIEVEVARLNEACRAIEAFLEVPS